jgi:hypothetical protein
MEREKKELVFTKLPLAISFLLNLLQHATISQASR